VVWEVLEYGQVVVERISEHQTYTVPMRLEFLQPVRFEFSLSPISRNVTRAVAAVFRPFRVLAKLLKNKYGESVVHDIEMNSKEIVTLSKNSIFNFFYCTKVITSS